MIPCAPEAPTVGFTIRTLELFRAASLRCPRLSIQAFTRTLCDLHRSPYQSYISKQFSVAYDTYLDILGIVDERINTALGRDQKGWRLRHACVPCTYKLQGEPDLKFSMLLTMDGNDSLKRLARRDKTEEVEGGRELGENHERHDPRVVRGDYYLSREEVDRWGKGSVALIPQKTEVTDPNGCDDRWKNMANEKTARMWGIFDETGIFLVLCRHSHVLLVMDMVRSGEQSKYPLAAVERLLDAFGSDLAIGYDIGCKFGTTLKNSALGPRAEELRTRFLVGNFHGHAHNRKCQLKNLAAYIDGTGLDPFEGCEPYFSLSNGLAPSTRSSSIFHRRQTINGFVKHTDSEDTYLSLSTILLYLYHLPLTTYILFSYKRALDIIAREGALFQQMHQQGLGKDTALFQRWLTEESNYLTNLSREPEEETLKMEYYQKLQSFYKTQVLLTAAESQWISLTPSTINTTPDETRRNETKRRQLQERHRREMDMIHGLEVKLDIKPEDRWIPGDKEWEETQQLVYLRRYRAAVDRLEGLVVARLFELTKMNMSQTGYKMRQQIGKALKARSQAIRSAVEDYNAAAKSVGRGVLTWDQVVQYTQLADFDLLSDTREDVRQRDWAKAGSRTLVDQFFKIKGARDEIKRLNIEIRRLTTYIRDEEAFLAHHVDTLSETQPLLAHQIHLRLISLKLKNDVHITRMKGLLKLPGFSGTLDEGVSIEGSQIPTTLIVRNDELNMFDGADEARDVGDSVGSGLMVSDGPVTPPDGVPEVAGIPLPLPYPRYLLFFLQVPRILEGF
ncbi:hypothetical protein BJ165DRAFT_1416052 [Panaeolus papilionaceus]|nr:hypothetical protein BJ165DRAFT_1416052 [Panaeolus papilionaceus]